MELRSDREVVISRTFRAPARLVFEAWTRPEFVKRWWSPKSCTDRVDCQAEVRVGGTFRYVMHTGGNACAFWGTYREITPHTRLVYTQVFEPFPDAEMLMTVTFEEHEGQTHLVSHELYPSREARDAALASGMEHGMRETMDQLDELVVSMR